MRDDNYDPGPDISGGCGEQEEQWDTYVRHIHERPCSDCRTPTRRAIYDRNHGHQVHWCFDCDHDSNG